MTTRTTIIEASKPSARALIGTTIATLALLGGALVWQGWQGGEAVAPAVARDGRGDATAGATGEPTAPSDAEMYQRWQGAQAVVGEAAPPAGVPALTDGSGRYFTGHGTTAAQETRMGVLAELYRDRGSGTARVVRTGEVSRCGLEVEQTPC